MHGLKAEMSRQSNPCVRASWPRGHINNDRDLFSHSIYLLYNFKSDNQKQAFENLENRY